MVASVTLPACWRRSSLHPHYMVSEELKAGTLEALLPGAVPEELDIHVVFSTRRNMPSRVRHLLEFLREWSRHPPDWALPATTAARGTAGR